MTYADIQKANETLHFTDVKGKAYAEVPQRVKAFRMLYPDGFIMTEMLSNNDGVCVFKASAGYYDERGDARILGTGTAYEREGSTFINKTSYIENCETSAVGRALGFLNLGSDTSIASAEEVANAVLQQDEKSSKKASWDARAALKAYCARHQISNEQFGIFRRSLINSGVIKEIRYDELEPIDFDTLCKAIEANFADQLVSVA